MSKYGSKKITIDNITFDSILESKYYEYLKVEQEEGRILAFQLQPTFELQEKFEKNGVKIRAITYKADFYVIYADGSGEVIDVKGFVTKDFAIKKKLFDYKYPALTLKCLNFVKKYGGWIELSELNKMRKKAKK